MSRGRKGPSNLHRGGSGMKTTCPQPSTLAGERKEHLSKGIGTKGWLLPLATGTLNPKL